MRLPAHCGTDIMLRADEADALARTQAGNNVSVRIRQTRFRLHMMVGGLGHDTKPLGWYSLRNGSKVKSGDTHLLRTHGRVHCSTCTLDIRC